MTDLPASFFAQGISAPKKIRLRVVADERCPGCREEGSPKVCDEQGRWHWKCLSPYSDCKVGYWLPGYGDRWIEYKLPPAEAEAQREKIRLQIEEQMKDRVWISKVMGPGYSQSKTIHKDEAIPEGWHLTGTHKDD